MSTSIWITYDFDAYNSALTLPNNNHHAHKHIGNGHTCNSTWGPSYRGMQSPESIQYLLLHVSSDPCLHLLWQPAHAATCANPGMVLHQAGQRRDHAAGAHLKGELLSLSSDAGDLLCPV